MNRKHIEPSTLEGFLRSTEADPELAEQENEMRPSVELALMMVGIRHERGWSQRRLAEVTGVSQAYIAKLESGTGNPSIRSLTTLLRRAGIKLELSRGLLASEATNRRVTETPTCEEPSVTRATAVTA